MHLLTTPLVYRLLTFNATPEKTRLVGIVLTILFTVVMVTHMVMDEFLLHATTFALAIYVIVTRSRRIIPHQCPDPKVRKSIQNVSTFGLGMSSRPQPVRGEDDLISSRSMLCRRLFRMACRSVCLQRTYRHAPLRRVALGVPPGITRMVCLLLSSMKQT